MSYDPEKHDRQSIRLPEWDYRRPAAYFVTVCTYRRQCLFGRVVDGRMVLNAWGRIVADEWHRTEQVRDNVVLDAFVVMPNHVHGIICITPDGNDSNSGTADRAPESQTDGDAPNRGRGSSPMNPYHGPMNPHGLTNPDGSTNPDDGHPHRTFGGAVAGSLSTIMRQFKSMVTKRINRRRDTPGAPVWQRNFYERIVRIRQELDRIRAYIRQNPARWPQDRMRPDG